MAWMRWGAAMSLGAALALSGAQAAWPQGAWPQGAWPQGAWPQGAWNNPWPADSPDARILYSSFRERPKTLDPARAYSANEYDLLAQICEPPFQYHYLKRPFMLVPLTAVEVPRPVLLDRQGRELPAGTDPARVAYSRIDIHLKPGIRYQPHAALASGREVVAADYVYQIKRLAHPKVHSPILSLMQEYILGLREYASTLEEAQRRLGEGGVLDLARFPLAGAEVVDRHTFRLTIHGTYPQILYWMAMPFFCPMPPEVVAFYAQPGMEQRNLTLDWFPVGSGAFMLTDNDPNRRMRLERNPNYHDERYPVEGEAADGPAGRLADAGRRLPFIDRVEFALERESIPYWTKFQQGWYDRSGVPAEGFDQAIRVSGTGEAGLSDSMAARGIHLSTSVATSTNYLAFNMLDPVVGGTSERARLLRRAIAIAVDYEEEIAIFRNGRGVPAQGPLPPGIFGYREGMDGINPWVYDWRDGRAVRKPVGAARALLTQAGFPEGRDPATGQPLRLHYDVTATGPEDKAHLDWYRKQFAKLGIDLVVRATDYNRFQEKIRKGDAQIFTWGWNADYPDPENFLFLLYGPNARVGHNGENSANYANPEFDRLFERMKVMDNTPERAALIREMVAIVQRDAPWAWGLHPKNFTLDHGWVHNGKPHQMANNTLKYLRLDPSTRTAMRAAWNDPVVWPVALLAGGFAATLLPAVRVWRKRQERRGIVRRPGDPA